MKHFLILFTLLIGTTFCYAQEVEKDTEVKGTIVDASTDKALEGVNIVNINQVIGTSTTKDGTFELKAKANDTLHLSYLGYKSIKVRVTNDWIKFGNSKITLTELALALEEVVVSDL
ncbi:carboxypeptidase-like regulatory domain-containing protein, partial [Pontimicrobium sp. MEBiC01747]